MAGTLKVPLTLESGNVPAYAFKFSMRRDIAPVRSVVGLVTATPYKPPPGGSLVLRPGPAWTAKCDPVDGD